MHWSLIVLIVVVVYLLIGSWVAYTINKEKRRELKTGYSLESLVEVSILWFPIFATFWIVKIRDKYDRYKRKKKEYPKVNITGSGGASAKPKDILSSESAKKQIKEIEKIKPDE